MKRCAGVAVISVIMITAVILILVVTFSTVAISERKSAATTTTVNTTLLAADSLSERGRMELVSAYDNGNYNIGSFLDTLRAQEAPNGLVTFNGLSGVISGTSGDVSGRWEVRGVSPAPSGTSDEKSGWVDIAATAATSNGTQTIIRRVGFGDPEIFQLAMLTETVNCMFCHLQVNGDVGALKTLRPGWGDEVNDIMGARSDCWVAADDKCDHGWGSGAANGGSKITGNVYAARDITNDDTVLTGSNKKINGTTVTGNIEAYSKSNKLPKDKDGDGIADFPPINREKARANAKGKINGAAIMIGSSLGGTVTNLLTSTISGVNKTYNGNLVLVGTASNPIDLSGDIFVEGDVVIKGVVKGIGGIYSGRNIYFAGDVTVQNPPDKPGNGICASISDPDACAKVNITAGRDTLRTGARGNGVIGDYTEFNSNALLPWSRRQSSDYYRSQFSFNSGNRYYDTQNGDELTYKDSKYYNVDGTEVIGANVKTIAASNSKTTDVSGDEAYDYSFRPGKVNSNGSFSTWMSDETYRQFLGTENFAYNTWRWGVGASISQTNFNNGLSQSFSQTGITLNSTTFTNVWNQRNNNDAEVELRDTNNNVVGRLHWGVSKDGSGNVTSRTIRVLTSTATTYETQVNRVDAFLYANQRIAGKTSMQAMAIEGGMIAKEIGVLAPGRRIEWPFDDNFGALDNKCNQATINGSANPFYVKDTMDCALTLNYDYRLRNGGYSFNLVSGEIGKTISWRVATNSSEKVSY
jgi:hypothetical protein